MEQNDSYQKVGGSRHWIKEGEGIGEKKKTTNVLST